MVGKNIVDISVGNQPSRSEDVTEINFGLGRYLGLGFYLYGIDKFGNLQYGGIVIHIGLGIGTPITISGSINDNSKVRFW